MQEAKRIYNLEKKDDDGGVNGVRAISLTKTYNTKGSGEV
jgi:hypothetical protein